MIVTPLFSVRGILIEGIVASDKKEIQLLRVNRKEVNTNYTLEVLQSYCKSLEEYIKQGKSKSLSFFNTQQEYTYRELITLYAELQEAMALMTGHVQESEAS